MEMMQRKCHQWLAYTAAGNRRHHYSADTAADTDANAAQIHLCSLCTGDTRHVAENKPFIFLSIT